MAGSPLLTTGEVGKVAGAAAPQFAVEEGVVVVVVAGVVLAVVLVVESADNVQAVACAVAPTVLNRMTRPRRAATNNASGAARRSTFFTVAPLLRAKGSEIVAQAKGE